MKILSGSKAAKSVQTPPIATNKSAQELAVASKAEKLIASMDTAQGGKSLVGRVNYPTQFPNLAQTVLSAGMRKEEHILGTQHALLSGMEQIQKELELIHNMSQQLTKLPSNKDSHEISQEMKEAAQKLKEIGIDILSADEKTLSNEKIAMIRADLDAGQSKRNNLLHTNFSKFQTTNSEHGSLIDCLRTIERGLSRLMSSIISNSIRR